MTREVPIVIPLIIPGGATSTTIIEERVVEITTTPLPVSDTATPIPPPETPTQESVLSTGSTFTDDFELGPDPAWEIQYGEPGMANGKYTVIAPFENIKTEHFSLLRENYLGNIAVTFELSIFKGYGSNKGFGAMILHYQEGVGGVSFIIHPERDGVQFGILNPDREWTLLPSSLVDHGDSGFDLDERAHESRIEVIGDTYIAYINNERVTSATIPGYESGQIGLWFLTSSYFDDPDYYAARFEYITIEILP
ncbi:MAG: hypothetical protein FVQ83_13855 [Chloroflexi bacterium]|nr:hypothetical protein [Chloroflexota bacterium]